MKIHIPNKFLPEKKYIINTLLHDFLGLDINIEIYDKKNYEIIIETDKKIIINDDFWANFDEQTGYLSPKNIPDKIKFAVSQYALEPDIPVIFGNSEIITRKNEIFCGIDIFASAFFMLTRWEEYVTKTKDKHKRFPDGQSLVQRNNIHYRPIVNEYVELLRNMLESLTQTPVKTSHTFEIIPTHDVDFLLKFDRFKDFLKSFGGDIVKRKNPTMAMRTLKKYYAVKRNFEPDPYDTFDFLMNISETNNVKSHFYFIAGQIGETDVRYDFLGAKTSKILRKIKDKGHIIGIHGSYDSFDNQKIFEQEIERFRKLEITVTEGRQHYLRFQNPLTWQIWESQNMQYDSTMGFANDGGFRCGVCYEFNIFDIVKRKKLNLKERPLIAMETALRVKHETKDEFSEKFLSLKKIVKKYNGQFVFLWHPSNFNTFLWKNFIDFYPRIFE